MEANWLITITVIIAVVAIIAFFIIQNRKDKKDLMRELIKNDEVSITKEQDTEVNSAD